MTTAKRADRTTATKTKPKTAKPAPKPTTTTVDAEGQRDSAITDGGPVDGVNPETGTVTHPSENGEQIGSREDGTRLGERERGSDGTVQAHV